MALGELQRAMRDIIRQPNAAVASGDPEIARYLRRVVDSGRLEVLTHVIRSWREFDLARACPLTTAALRARGLWQAALDSSGVESAGSAFVERLADRFLEIESENRDSLVATVARFEAAYLAVRRGSNERFVVSWDREPTTVLGQLAAGDPLGEAGGADGSDGYLTIVARELPGYVEVIPQATATTR